MEKKWGIHKNKMMVLVCIMVCWWSGGVRGQGQGGDRAQPVAVFIFGDSLVDSGNNNYLVTTARADMTPYGIDYVSGKPTGRFSNGLNIADFISLRLGAEPVLPYLNPAISIPNNLLRGANFASAGIGIINDTGIQFPNIIRMPQQLEFFREYQNRVAAIIGPGAAESLVSKGLVSIFLGGNDYVNNYYLLPVTARSLRYNVEDYTRFIISEYKKILERLYELGGRRILVMAVGPIGCAPSQRELRTLNGECDPVLQRAVAFFNSELATVISDLNTQYDATVYTLADAFRMKMNLITDPIQFGFETSQIACCGQGRFNGMAASCNAQARLCANRSAYVFWDAYHPTERANRMIVDIIMIGNSSQMNPVNLSTMLQLNL